MTDTAQTLDDYADRVLRKLLEDGEYAPELQYGEHLRVVRETLKAAAAPDLYEELDSLSGLVERAWPSLAELGPLATARAALAKARGQ